MLGVYHAGPSPGSGAPVNRIPGYAVGHGPHLAPGEPAAERDSFDEVVLVGRLRGAIRRLDPVIPSRTLASLRDTLLPKLLSGELSVEDFVAKMPSEH